MREKGLTGNQLKLIALITMTVDHIGFLLFPRLMFLRIIGRLSLPIYAYLLAEGCTHTRSMGRYLGSVLLVGFVCQVVSFVAANSLRQCILISFALSIGLIWLVRLAQEKKRLWLWLLPILGTAGVWFLIRWMDGVWQEMDFAIDYGFWGVMLPVVIYLGRTRTRRLLTTAAGLLLLLLEGFLYQEYALLALPLLALYNGQRGQRSFKWLHYIYYPAHMAVLYGIAWVFHTI